MAIRSLFPATQQNSVLILCRHDGLIYIERSSLCPAPTEVILLSHSLWSDEASICADGERTGSTTKSQTAGRFGISKTYRIRIRIRCLSGPNSEAEEWSNGRFILCTAFDNRPFCRSFSGIKSVASREGAKPSQLWTRTKVLPKSLLVATNGRRGNKIDDKHSMWQRLGLALLAACQENYGMYGDRAEALNIFEPGRELRE